MTKVVLEVIEGYRIPFITLPPCKTYSKEPMFSEEMGEKCDKEIFRLLNKKVIVPCNPSEEQFLSPFFLTEKSSGSMRFILNLKELNNFVEAPHFKLEDWRTVVQFLLPDIWMTNLDLEDAYLSVPIYEPHRKFLRFQ